MRIIKATDDVKTIQNALDEGGEIIFEQGTYLSANYKITQTAHIKGYGALLVGGAPVKWTRDGDKLVCDVDCDNPLRVLSVNGSLRCRSRFPAVGYMQHDSVFDVRWMSTTGGGWQRKPTHEELTTLTAKPDSLNGLTLDNAEATIVHSWDDSLLTVESVDGNKLTFTGEGGHPAGAFDVKDYCLWNIPECLTEAGTFYHDVKAGKLYYKPFENEDENTIAYIPDARSIFEIVKPVDGLEIEGFELTVTDTPRESAGFGASRMTGAIEFKSDCVNGKFHDMKIYAVGGYGIRTCAKFEANDLYNLEICDAGAGGVRLICQDKNKKSCIHNSSIHNVGKYYPSAIGVQVSNVDVVNNEVCHTSYSAINCGGDGILIEGNILHDVMEVLNDGAAIYSFGSHDGIMRRNLAWGIHPHEGHPLRIAYYLDEVSTGWTVENNMTVDCDYPNHNHMCGNHIYRSNTFINGNGGIKVTMQRCENIKYIDNVIIAKDQIIFHTPEKGISEFSGNRYISCDGNVNINLLNGYSGGEPVPMELDKSNKLLNG